jgi:hypothetical protein
VNRLIKASTTEKISKEANVKTEQQIKARIKELGAEGSLTSLVCIMMLLWVLDIENSRLINYSEDLRTALTNIDMYIDKL